MLFDGVNLCLFFCVDFEYNKIQGSPKISLRKETQFVVACQGETRCVLCQTQKTGHRHMFKKKGGGREEKDKEKLKHDRRILNYSKLLRDLES